MEGAFSYLNRTANLAAQGITLVHVPFPGISFPVFVGPFNTMDGRLSASQTVLNLTSIRQYQASKVGVSAAKSDSESVTEQVAAVVARAYLAAVRAVTDVETAQANVMLSQAVLTQAENQKNAGTGTGIEITRAQVQLANDQQLALVAENDVDRTRLQLLRAIGLRLDNPVELTGRLEYVPTESMNPAQALEVARAHRAELKAQERREDNARLNYSATKMERLPTVAALSEMMEQR